MIESLLLFTKRLENIKVAQLRNAKYFQNYLFAK